MSKFGNEPTAPKFVIGIGSQRAGSTLLYRILGKCTDVFMHPVKELHYFDTMHSVRDEAVLRKYSQIQLSKENNNPIQSNFHQLTSKRFSCFIKTLRLLSTHSVATLDYLDLYTPCINEKRLLGEITPEYMILPEAGVNHMAKMLGSDTKIILIARNPTQRFISSVKLLKANTREPAPNETFETELLKTMVNMPAWMAVQDRLNDYESALSIYGKYFENVLFLSFDKLTKNIQETHSLLEGFLERPVNKKKYRSLLGTRINAIDETAPISDKVIQLLDSRYEDSIVFLERHFGADNCVL